MLAGIFGLVSTFCALYGAWYAYDRHDEPIIALAALMLGIGIFAWTLRGIRL